MSPQKNNRLPKTHNVPHEVDFEKTQDMCVRLWQSARKKQGKCASCQAPSVNHEDPFVGATIDAVKKPSDTGRCLQWLLKKVVKPAQSNFVSSATMQS